MKKAVKALTIAASVAAIAGIGAVSFAKWSATTSSQDVTGKTGTVNTVGAVTLVSNSLGAPEGGGTAKTLVPYDQETADGYKAADHVKVWKIGVKATYTGTAPTLEIAAGFGTDMATTFDKAKLYIYKGADEITDANVTSKVTSDISTDSNWQAITSSAKYEFTLTASDTEKCVYIVLDATETAGMDTDLKATVGVKASA